MLEHKNASQTQPSPAAQVRVTPEELAAAVTALQVRKEGQPGTIAIGDAVEELGLDVTPEEVLQAVYFQRDWQGTSRRKKRFSAIVAVLAMMSAASAGMLFHTRQRLVMPKTISAAVVQPASRLRPVDAMPDGQDFYADAHALNQFFQKNQPRKIMVSLTGSDQDWEMVKHNGKVYLTAFEPPISARGLEQKHTVLYNCQMEQYFSDKNGSASADCVIPTVPIGDVRLEDTQFDEHGEKIVVSNIHTDNYLW